VNIEMSPEGYYIATGEGELRPIVAEGNTLGEARQLFYQAQCDQYAEAQSKGYLSEKWMNGGTR
jgi:hypothetical protein